MCFSGRFKVSALTIQMPPENMLCRPISKIWVDQIKSTLKTDPALHQTILPVLSSAPPGTTITEENVNNYPMYSLGGNHLLEAIKKCLEDDDSEHQDTIRYVDVDIYKGLSLVESRRVGNAHNYRTRTFEMCFIDGVTQARRLLFEMLRQDNDDIDPPNESPAGYRAELLRQLGTSKVHFVCISIRNM